MITGSRRFDLLAYNANQRSDKPSKAIPTAELVAALTERIGAQPLGRQALHTWQLSAVERIYLDGGGSVILKSACSPLDSEHVRLRHVNWQGVPTPRLLDWCAGRGRLHMLLEDLGEPFDYDISTEEGATAAVSVHACPPPGCAPVLGQKALCDLPKRGLMALDALESSGQWTDTSDVRHAFLELERVAPQRSEGVEFPPYGLCHGEFRPLSLHNGPRGLRILDWARAFTGPGLLDLASWDETPKPLDTERIGMLISMYIDAGGSPSAAAERGGLPAEVWAGGWHRVWIIEWYLQQLSHWIPELAKDERTLNTVRQAVRRHVAEAMECLT